MNYNHLGHVLQVPVHHGPVSADRTERPHLKNILYSVRCVNYAGTY